MYLVSSAFISQVYVTAYIKVLLEGAIYIQAQLLDAISIQGIHKRMVRVQ
jgi:hypothetical protein